MIQHGADGGGFFLADGAGVQKSGHKAGQAAAKAFLHDGGAFFLLNLGLFDQCRYGAFALCNIPRSHSFFSTV